MVNLLVRRPSNQKLADLEIPRRVMLSGTWYKPNGILIRQFPDGAAACSSDGCDKC